MLQNIHFIDKSFDYVNVDKYHMSLQVFLKGFSFSVLDRERNKYVALAHYQFNRVTSFRTLAKQIDSIFDSEPLLQCRFSHVKLLFATTDYTFVPAAYFVENEKDVWFRFNQELKRGYELMSNYIFGNSSYVVFSIPTVLADIFRDRFESVRFYHQSVPMIEDLTLRGKLDSGDKRVYINMMPAFFDFVLVDNGEIELYNTFSYKSTDDFNYFFLNAVDSLRLPPMTVPVNVCGILPANSPIMESMKKYVRNIGYFVMPSHFEYAYGFNDIPSHYFTNMINLYQCG